MDPKQIKHSELTFQLMIESAPNAIVLVNKEGKIAYINSQTEKLFGYDRTELIGKMIEELLPKRYQKNHPGFRSSFFEAPSVRAMGAGRELYASKKDGKEFPVEIGLNPLVTADGTLVLASIIDITERKKADERFKLVVESAPNAMILVNNEGIITLVNAQTVEVFGYEKNELIGNKLEMLIPERFKKNHPGHRKMFFSSPSTRAMGAGRDLYAQRKSGEEIQVEIGLNPIETEDGQMVLASIVDITERKTQEAIIKNQVSELQIKNKELEQFAYIASHDLQEPLRTVSNFIQIIEEDYGSNIDEKVAEHLTTIDLATKRMSAMVKALLDFSRLGRNRVLANVDCNILLSDVISDLEGLITSTDTELTVSELPTLNAYETELRLLFQNLISNAIKFRKEDVKPRVQIGCNLTKDGWCFYVRDNGIGIEEKNFEKIFNIFQRLHLDEEHEGYGIGLANCKKIVELHEGKIWVESIMGQGSTFFCTIKELKR